MKCYKEQKEDNLVKERRYNVFALTLLCIIVRDIDKVTFYEQKKGIHLNADS